MMCFFPVLVDSMSGFRAVDPRLYQITRSMGASRWQTFAYLRLPASMAHIYAGMRIGIVKAVEKADIDHLLDEARTTIGNVMAMSAAQARIVYTLQRINALTGYIISISGVPDIVVTLATSYIWSGVALSILPSPGGGTAPGFRWLFTGAESGIGGSAIMPILMFIWCMSTAMFGMALILWFICVIAVVMVSILKVILLNSTKVVFVINIHDFYFFVNIHSKDIGFTFCD